MPKQFDEKLITSSSVIKLTYLVSATFYLILATHVPLELIFYSPHDDAHFWTQAYSLVSGQWLGSFNELTFSKGPGFSFFEAFNVLTGFPVTLTFAIFYVGASFVFVSSTKTLIQSEFLRVTLFVLLMVQPGSIPTRPIRDYFYISLLLLLMSGLIKILSERNSGKKPVHIALLGVAAGTFFVTREEWLWIIPMFLLVFISIALEYKSSPLARKQIVKITAIFAGFTILVPTAIATLNYSIYGVFRVTDSASGPFFKALGSLESIRSSNPISFVPVSNEALELGYKVSPALRELRPYFDGPGQGWIQQGCKGYSKTCQDFAAAWFMWSFRSAVKFAGHYGNAQEADNFFNTVASQVDDACARKLIVCVRPALPIVPSLSEEDIARLPNSIQLALLTTTYQRGFENSATSSSGPIGGLNLVRSFLGSPRSFPSQSEQVASIQGWYISKNDSWIALDCKGKITDIARLPSSDVQKSYPVSKASENRFNLEYPMNNSCNISPQGTTLRKTYSLDELPNLSDFSDKSSDETFQVDIKIAPEYKKSWQFALEIKESLLSFQKTISAPLLIMGIASFLIFGMNRRSSAKTRLFFFALMSIFLVRAALLVVIDSHSFPAINSLYMAPNLILVPIISIFGISFLWEFFRSRSSPDERQS